jgi:ATP-dependent Clp protease protease subunit
VSAQLLTLEALSTPRSGRTIQLQVSSADGTLEAAFAVIDVLDVMKVPVKAVAIGEVGGAALGVYAAAPIRVAYPHARFTLAEPRADELSGTADEVTRAAGAHLRLLEDLAVRIATATKHSQAEVERDLSDRRRLTAAEAVEYGLVDELVGRADRR